MDQVSKKVILLGHFGVGKSSLVKRFVHQLFSEEYHTTIGVKVDKKVLEVNGKQLTMIIWDIEGGAVQSKLPQSYFLGALGIIYVLDLTRPSTWENMPAELGYFQQLLPKASTIIVGNKRDLLDPREEAGLLTELKPYQVRMASAKTGEGVEEMFTELGIHMVK
jgi:small GTP-binding protein